MSELLSKRLARELFLAAVGVEVETLGEWVLDRLTAISDEEDIAKGQVLWREGDALESFYFMRKGLVRSVRDGAPPWTFEGRWFLGAFEGNMDRPARRTTVALADFHALTVPRRDWFDLLEDSFPLARLGILRTAGVVADLEEQVGPDDFPALTLDQRPAPVDASLGIIERLALLTELAMARGAGVQALADLAVVSREVTVGAYTPVFHEEDDREDLFLVVEGAVEIARPAGGSTRRYVAGQVLGGPAALSPKGRAWNARSLTPARLLAVPVEAWFDLMEEHFDLVHSTLAGIAQQREVLMERLAAKAGPEGLLFH